MERVINCIQFSFLVWRCHFLLEVGIYVKKLRQFLANESSLDFLCTAFGFYFKVLTGVCSKWQKSKLPWVKECSVFQSVDCHINGMLLLFAQEHF